MFPVLTFFSRRRSLAHDGGAVSTRYRIDPSAGMSKVKHSTRSEHFDDRGSRLFTEHIHTMSRSKRYTQNGAERIGLALRSVSCLCATDGGRLLHPPSADENERPEVSRGQPRAPVCVRSVCAYAGKTRSYASCACQCW